MNYKMVQWTIKQWDPMLKCCKYRQGNCIMGNNYVQHFATYAEDLLTVQNWKVNF